MLDATRNKLKIRIHQLCRVQKIWFVVKKKHDTVDFREIEF